MLCLGYDSVNAETTPSIKSQSVFVNQFYPQRKDALLMLANLLMSRLPCKSSALVDGHIACSVTSDQMWRHMFTVRSDCLMIELLL